MICKGTLNCVELYCVAVHWSVELSRVAAHMLHVCVSELYRSCVLTMNFIDYCEVSDPVSLLLTSHIVVHYKINVHVTGKKCDIYY